MNQPSIYLFGYLIHEPVTVFTNIILCICCAIFGLNVGKSNAKYWSCFFYTVSIATFFAALGHGLYLDKNNILQLISRCANILAVYIASIASVVVIKFKYPKILLFGISLIQLIIALIYIFIYNEFWIVEWDAIVGLGIMVAGIHIFLASHGNKGSIIILVGIIINAMTAYIHSNKIYISKWFNHNDISHVILIFGFYFMAKGAIKLQEYYAIN